MHVGGKISSQRATTFIGNKTRICGLVVRFAKSSVEQIIILIAVLS